MAACEDCGGKAGLLATVCPSCTAKRNEQLKKQKAAENAAAEQERQLLIAEEYKRIIHDVKAGFKCFLYNSYYVSVDGILAGGNFESNVYDDVNVTQYTPAPNTGIGDPTFFGTVPAPTISSEQPTSAIPSFNVNVTTSSSGITQYAEIWYSAFTNPTSDQRIFAGTTAIQSNGNPYDINELPLC